MLGVRCAPYMKGIPVETEFIVIGAGVAGLRAAIELAEAGSVLLLTKGEIPEDLAKPIPSRTLVG